MFSVCVEKLYSEFKTKIFQIVLLPLALLLTFVLPTMSSWFFYAYLNVLVILPRVFLPQRSWPVNCRAVRTNAWCCIAVWSAGPSATRCPASCSWKSELSLSSLNTNCYVWVRLFQFSREFSCFSPQPWWLAVLLAIFWLFVPPHWSELDASTGRSSVRKKLIACKYLAGKAHWKWKCIAYCLWVMQISRLYRAQYTHILHTWK